ncbi:hypothetical protein BGZ96_008799 [Linnemannia gamsii]|uniref:F-box domain-containing protein n=1 Tax=Linnemannia gamsii TaxID=64522 RepID=A0ABQ7JY61_9FUNG|nr:hypothetical protein BGZ96_008799 [Linnemannia gamsii]
MSKPESSEHPLTPLLSSLSMAEPQHETTYLVSAPASATTDDTTPPTPHRIFYLPEVLAHIFAFLSPYVVIQYASLVCRDWLDVSRRFSPLPPIVAVWAHNLTDVQTQELYLNILPDAKVLHIASSILNAGLEPTVLADYNILWKQLTKRIQHVSAGNSLSKIFRLVFAEQEQNLQSRIASLLGCSSLFASNLQEIRIEILSMLDVTSFDVDVILDACPMLRELSITGQDVAYVQVGLSKDHTLWTRTAFDRPLMLQSLTMKSILVSQRFLNTMTGASPHLVKLEIFSVCLGNLNATTGRFEPETIQKIEFFHHVGRSCPRLEFVQVSICGILLGANEMDDFRSTFSTTPHWSFSRSDFHDQDLKNFLLPRQPTDIQEAALSCLRSLEIHPEGNHIGLQKALHAYLTSPQAATLEHLKIMGANYPLSYFESGFLAPENAWTCKGLQTLHLRAYHETGILSPDGFSQGPANKWLSRHVFIGLTGAFKKMRDLRIDCPNIDFSLEGGMCLLRRMSDLERLRVKSMRERRFTERDLAWLHPDPTPEQHAQNADILIEIQDQIRIYRGGSGRRMTRGYRRLDRDQSIAGTLEQVADLLEEIQTKGVARRCLPYLESLIVEQGGIWHASVHESQQERTRDIMKRMKGSFFFHLTMAGAPPKLGVGP